jgi:hypothetical protein
MAMTASIDNGGEHIAAMVKWNELNFSDFAFDWLAIMRGNYKSGFLSSLHGLDVTHLARKAANGGE